MASYAKEALSLTRYSPLVLITDQSNLSHLAMTATKVVLDLTKAVTFVITGVFILLLFGIPSQTHFNPTWCYILVTLFYYCLTEKTSKEELVADMLTYFQLDVFESLEILWTPVLIRVMTSFSSGLFYHYSFYFIFIYLFFINKNSSFEGVIFQYLTCIKVL